MAIPEILNISTHQIPEVVRIAHECGLAEWPESEYLAEAEREDSIFLGVTNGEGLAGYIVGRFVPSAANEGLNAEIFNIGIAPRFRRRGFAGLLFDRFLAECRIARVAEIWLEVRESNAGAIAFYENKGFERVFTRRDYYRDPVENAVIMRVSAGPVNKC